MGELQGTPLGRRLLERFVKSYNITLSEAELLDVVTSLTGASAHLRHGPAATKLYELSRRIADQAAEQFYDARLDAREQLSLPYILK